MGLLDDLRRSFEAGRATGRGQSRAGSARHDRGAASIGHAEPSDFFGGDFEDERPEPPHAASGFAGDELAECKALIAGLLQEKEGVKAQLEQWAAAVKERDELIGTLHKERDRACAERDRYQATGERASAQLRELESIIAFPGALNGLRKALHPDTGTGGDVPSRTAIFKTLNAIVARLGIR